MSDQTGKLSSMVWSFALGGLAGALAAVMLVMLGNFGWNGAVFTGALLAVSVGLYLSVVLARPLPTMAEVNTRMAARPPMAAAHAAVAVPVAVPVPMAAPAPAAALAPAAEPAPAPAAAPVAEPVAEPVAAPVHVPAPAPDGPAKPVFLTAARDGGADDLKLIKGVGPKLELMLHGMGVFHFDQIGSWTAAEVAWVDDNLEGFKGRVSRDGWVGQARRFAAGGTV